MPWLTVELPCQQFADLIHDRIVPWRLLEDGFIDQPHGRGYIKDVSYVQVSVIDSFVVAVISFDTQNSIDTVFSGVKTYTDLLKLIELIG